MRIQSLLLKTVVLAEFLPRYFNELALQQFASVAIIILGMLVSLWVLFVLIDWRSLLLPFMLR